MFSDAKTIEAIGQLRETHPYAAALLIYVVVERVLKGHLLDHRSDAQFAGTPVPKGPHAGLFFKDLPTLTHEEFVTDVLRHITLGKIEEVLQIPNAARSATDRNDAMHSNLYLKQEAFLDDQGRRQKNIERLARAMEHLQRTIESFTEHKLVDQKGCLTAQPNPALLPADPARRRAVVNL